MDIQDLEHTGVQVLPPVEKSPEVLPPEVPAGEWDQQIQTANPVCRLIDRHLDYEARGRLLIDLRDYRPQHLCPEQRVQMISDLYAELHRR